MPFYSDKLYQDLTQATGRDTESVHLSSFPKYESNLVDKDLEERMEIAQKVSSMVLGLRRKVSLKVRQPLQKIMVPILNEKFQTQLKGVEDLILSELNVKELEYLTDTTGVLVKKIKPNFKTLGPKYGKIMKAIAGAIAQFDQDAIATFEKEGKYKIEVAEQTVDLSLEDVEIVSQDIPGWLVAAEGNITVALDVTLTEELKQEGLAREFINRIQNLRKDSGFEVTDKINIEIVKLSEIEGAINTFGDYIAEQTLAESIVLVDAVKQTDAIDVEIEEGLSTQILIKKI